MGPGVGPREKSKRNAKSYGLRATKKGEVRVRERAACEIQEADPANRRHSHAPLTLIDSAPRQQSSPADPEKVVTHPDTQVKRRPPAPRRLLNFTLVGSRGRDARS